MAPASKVYLLAALFLLTKFTNGFVANQSRKDLRLRIAVFGTSPNAASIENSPVPVSEVSRTQTKIPIHLLAGFLGSGKTTTLKHVLENKEDIRVGVIVNDVASVNIDAKLISRRETKSKTKRDDSIIDGDEGRVVELQNGCACCSLAGELFDSIEALLQPRDETSEGEQRRAYDAILVELSGVADPLAIKNNWKEAVQTKSNRLVTDCSQLGNVVTVVDATTFGNDYMTFDILKDRDGWFESDSPSEDQSGNQKHPHALNRQVVELLAEQVEAANLIVVNKQDLAGHEKVQVTKTMAQTLNADAKVLVTSHGKIKAKELLGMTSPKNDMGGTNIMDSSHSHDHHHSHDDKQETSDSHSHNHSHSHDHTTCDDPDCTDDSHSHALSQDNTKCEDVNCTDPSHDHSHSHDHNECTDANCTDPSHDHSHSHNHATCTDANCTDPSHDHSHSHDHTDTMTSTANLGISSFVYKATRPFEPKRLRKILFEWPIPIKGELDFDLLNDTLKTGYGIDEDSEKETSSNTSISPFVGVLRSKGFCWIAPTAWEGLLADPWRHDTAMYWSHAGKHFGLEPGGRFWDSLPRSALQDFFAGSADAEASIRKILNEDFVTEEFGDRRQELVFIGVTMRQKDIEAALDDCLLTDDEMEDYRNQLVVLNDSSNES